MEKGESQMSRGKRIEYMVRARAGVLKGVDLAWPCHAPVSRALGALSSAALMEEGSSRGFPVGSVVENLPANAGDMGSIPGLGRSHRLQGT